jgi:outer membrane immunogenic protein
MIRTLLAGAVATGTIVLANLSVAQAADMPVAYKAPPRPACAQFGGLYIGGNVGWAYHDQSWTDRDAWIDNFGTDWALGTVDTTRGGFSGGLQAGWNYQMGCTVIGLEIDGSWTDIGGSKSYSPTGLPADTTLTLADDLNWWGSVRARAGVVVDNLLLYGTAGIAYASIDHTFTVTDPGGVPPVESFSNSDTRWGLVAGLGAEWALNANWSVKAEGLYVRFEEANTSGFSPNGPQTVNFDNNDSMWVARLGVNYRFGGR